MLINLLSILMSSGSALQATQLSTDAYGITSPSTLFLFACTFNGLILTDILLMITGSPLNVIGARYQG